MLHNYRVPPKRREELFRPFSDFWSGFGVRDNFNQRDHVRRIERVYDEDPFRVILAFSDEF